VTIPRELRRAARTARRSGWTLTATGGGHIKWESPGGEVVITGSTPGGGRATKNGLACLRRAGLRRLRRDECHQERAGRHPRLA
jgi:hypothetical protein